MLNYFIIPGLGGSGPDHWQTIFEKSGENFQRIVQKNWDEPNINDWVMNISYNFWVNDQLNQWVYKTVAQCINQGIAWGAIDAKKRYY